MAAYLLLRNEAEVRCLNVTYSTILLANVHLFHSGMKDGHLKNVKMNIICDLVTNSIIFNQSILANNEILFYFKLSIFSIK